MPGGGNLVKYERYRKGPPTPRSAHARYYYTKSMVLDSPVRKRYEGGPQKTRCQSAPKIMDSHSRSASPREPMRPQHRPPSPPSSPAAFDNRAYQHDEGDPNHNDSFTSNGPQQNGHSKEPNGDTKLPEAVNLELINLTPKNGTKKKDVEVDMNASNPYDEYFVPVNEHRKFMRGEKLYVTADKRGEKSGCKRPLCWTLLVLVVAAIVAIIVLAATGILFSSSPTTLEQYNTSISSARAFGGIGDHDHDHHDHDHHDHDHHDHDHHDHDHHDHDHPDVTAEPSSMQHGPETQNDEAHVHAVESDENDASMYVPRTVEGELKIDNEEFKPSFEDTDSTDYREFVATFSDGLKRALFDRNTLENSDHDVIVEVIKLSKGSVVVTYRIHWKPKLMAEPTKDILSAESLQTKLDNYLSENNRMINIYHVAEDKMPTKPVLDLCQIDNNHCEYGCEFDETILDFTCTCPHGQILDITNSKKCMAILENAYPTLSTSNTEQNVPVFKVDMNPSTTKPVPEDEKPVTESVHVNDNVFDWKESNHEQPETIMEHESDLNFSHIFGQGHHDTEMPVAEPSAESLPEPTAEPKAEPEPTAEPNVEPEPTSEPKAEPEPTAEPKPEPEPAAEPKAEPEPTAEPKPEPEATAEHKPEPELIPEPKLEPVPTSEPKAEPEITEEPKAEPEPTAEPKAEPEPTAEPKAEPEPTAEPKVEPESITEPESHVEFKLEPESEAEPKAESAPTSELNEDKQKSTEPAAEPAAEPSSEEHKVESEPSSEHSSAEDSILGLHVVPSPITESAPEPTSEPESQAEPTSEPKPQMELQSESKPTSEPKTSIVETPTMTTQFSLEDHLHVDHENEPATHSVEDVAHIAPESAEGEKQETTPAEKSILTVYEGNYDPKISDGLETTTRVSISEPNIINEPSYEPKPEIISIFSEKQNSATVPKIIENSETTTEQDEWLQDNSQSDVQKPIELEHSNNNELNESEPRSFKSINIFAEEPTTIKTEEQDMSTNPIDEETKPAVTETSKKSDEEIITLINPTKPESDHAEKEIIKNMNTDTTFYVNKSLHDNDNQNTAILDDFKEENFTKSNTTDEKTNNEESPAITNEGRSLEFDENPLVTVSPELAKVYSGGKDHDSEIEGKLIEALEKRNNSVIETTTEKKMPDEGMDITFDTINMLYNRSSKSIENSNESKTEQANGIPVETTTVAEWLSEPITEIKYEDAINKMEKQTTTETIKTIIDDVMNVGVTKDDFEPDYLNSNKNKMTDQDVPVYGMVHDYDSEDSRVKRVNEENEVSTKATGDEVSSEVKVKQNVPEITPAPLPVETTTVIEYIYKSAEKNMSEPDTQKDIEEVYVTTTSTTEKSEPAPVWEDSESEKDLTVKEIQQPVNTTENITTSHVIPIDEITVNNTLLTTMTPITSQTAASPSTEATPAPTTISNLKEIPRSESETETQTQANNLNVTIYEISSHSGNNSFAVTNSHSGEYEDHETEMNPFLPEVENNKSLVKKLQEGHDIEPTTFNETQNENVEEHSNNNTETTAAIANNDGLNVDVKVDETKISTTTTAAPVTTEQYTTFDELLLKTNSHENKTPNDVTEKIATVTESVSDKSEENKPEEKETVPISTFLLDTDDLDNDKRHKTDQKTTIAENNLENGATTSSLPSKDSSDDSDYLSVVPIEEERLEEKEALKKDYGSEFNDISDSPKKSDRRTLDETKFDSVINNEA